MTNLLQARIAFDCADFPHAREALSRLATVPDVIGDHGAYHSLLLEQAAIDRIGQASSPDLRQLLATYQSEKALPCYQISARWLAGEVSWEDALHEAAADEWGDTLWYVRGLYHLTIGEHAAARADLAKVIVEHPDWHEAWTCQALLRWYDRQTPEALAALPRAPVITPRVAPGGPTKTTGDDF